MRTRQNGQNSKREKNNFISTEVDEFVLNFDGTWIIKFRQIKLVVTIKESRIKESLFQLNNVHAVSKKVVFIKHVFSFNICFDL